MATPSRITTARRSNRLTTVNPSIRTTATITRSNTDNNVALLEMGAIMVGGWDQLKKNICQKALILPDCENSIQIEMQAVAAVPGAVANIRGSVLCRDKASKINPATLTTYDIGAENQIMLVRVCALSNPLFPTTKLGLDMKVDAEGNYALVTAAAFVNEPGSRAIASTKSGGLTGAY